MVISRLKTETTWFSRASWCTGVSFIGSSSASVHGAILSLLITIWIVGCVFEEKNRWNKLLLSLKTAWNSKHFEVKLVNRLEHTKKLYISQNIKISPISLNIPKNIRIFVTKPSLRELVLVCIGVAVKRTMYQRKVDVDMLNAVKSVLADVSSVKARLHWRFLLRFRGVNYWRFKSPRNRH